MAKVITFSRYFPTYHPKKGQPTNFVEKIWLSLNDCGELSLSKSCELSRETGIGSFDMNNIRKCPLKPKGHTIRAGNRWKVGDKFSPRVWSGKPYASKMITIAPDIEIKKIWTFDIVDLGGVLCYRINNEPSGQWHPLTQGLEVLARNDGLSVIEMIQWFNIYPNAKNKEFAGQILCWSDSIKY